MGRIRPSWYYERQAREANAREAFRSSYAGPPEGTTITPRPPQTTAFYRSLLKKTGTEHLVYQTSVPTPTLAVVPLANAGLLATAPANTATTLLRGSGLKPCRASWYTGDPTPIYELSDWGTRWARYYQRGSHRSIPLSVATGEFEPEDIIATFDLLFGTGGTARPALGTTNGRAQLTLERVSKAYNN